MSYLYGDDDLFGLLQTVMFATLSSFLPSALQQGSPNPASAPTKDPTPAKVEVSKPKDVAVVAVDEGSTRKKEKRTNHEVRLCHTSPLSVLTSLHCHPVVHRRTASSCQVQSPFEPASPARPSTIS